MFKCRATAVWAAALCQGGCYQKAVWGAALRHPDEDDPYVPLASLGILDSQHLYMMEEELVEAEGRVEKLKWNIRAWKRVMKAALQY